MHCFESGMLDIERTLNRARKGLTEKDIANASGLINESCKRMQGALGFLQYGQAALKSNG